MKAKIKPAKPLLARAKNKPVISEIRSTDNGLEATEFKGLKPEQYEAACIFEMIVDLSSEERQEVPEHLQHVVRIVEVVENQVGREPSNHPSWRQLNFKDRSWVARKKDRGTIVKIGRGSRLAVSFFTGDLAAAINPPVLNPSQAKESNFDTNWPLTLPTRTTDPQTIALEIHWRAGLHQIRSEITQWLEKNAPPGTPGSGAPAMVDPSAPAKGRSPYKRPASILLLIAICRELNSGKKQGEIRPQVASQSLVAHAKGKLIEEYRKILNVNPPQHLKKAR